MLWCNILDLDLRILLRHRAETLPRFDEVSSSIYVSTDQCKLPIMRNAAPNASPCNCTQSAPVSSPIVYASLLALLLPFLRTSSALSGLPSRSSRRLQHWRRNTTPALRRRRINHCNILLDLWQPRHRPPQPSQDLY